MDRLQKGGGYPSARRLYRRHGHIVVVNALSALIEKQFEWDAELGQTAIVDTLNSISVCRADTYYREYRDYVAEVRRRHPSI